MELRVLRYFLTVARTGSITGAANYLHLTQPTLSRQLQDLEHELGHKLFIRTNHSVSLTPEGVILRKRAEEILDMVEKTETEFLAISNTLSGNIYIGCGETESMKYIAEIMKQIQISYPNIKFHIQSGNAEDITEKLDKGLLDFGVLIQPVDLIKYNHIPLPQKDIWGVVMRKDSPLASKESIKLEDLRDLPLLNSRQALRKTSTKNQFLEWFQGEFNNLNTVATFNLVYNAAIMVRLGIGYAITLDKLVNTSEESELCFRPLNPKLESRLDMVWKKKSSIFTCCQTIFRKNARTIF